MENLIINIENNISIIENDIIIGCKFKLPNNFLSKYNNYRITALLMLNYPQLCNDLKDIMIDKTTNIEIWLNEYYDIINDHINFTNVFHNIIKNGYYSGYITPIQHKLVSIILKKINNIWYSDYFIKNLYKKRKNLPNIKELNFFFDIIDIIYYKFSIYNKSRYDDNINEQYLLNHDIYLNNISKLSKKYEELYINNNNNNNNNVNVNDNNVNDNDIFHIKNIK